jgi:hypothetical protein
MMLLYLEPVYRFITHELYALDEKRTVRFVSSPIYRISCVICQFLRADRLRFFRLTVSAEVRETLFLGGGGGGEKKAKKIYKVPMPFPHVHIIRL